MGTFERLVLDTGIRQDAFGGLFRFRWPNLLGEQIVNSSMRGDMGYIHPCRFKSSINICHRSICEDGKGVGNERRGLQESGGIHPIKPRRKAFFRNRSRALPGVVRRTFRGLRDGANQRLADFGWRSPRAQGAGPLPLSSACIRARISAMRRRFSSPLASCSAGRPIARPRSICWSMSGNSRSAASTKACCTA